jgi:hypothetical protein
VFGLYCVVTPWFDCLPFAALQNLHKLLQVPVRKYEIPKRRSYSDLGSFILTSTIITVGEITSTLLIIIIIIMIIFASYYRTGTRGSPVHEMRVEVARLQSNIILGVLFGVVELFNIVRVW